MARHLLDIGVDKVRIFSRDEAKQDHLRAKVSDDRLEFVVGDVRDFSSVRNACRGVQHVFHAAALKQVPSCEFFPAEAVKTNILGSMNVIEAAEACGLQSAVFLSTDKAVYPINAMGMSKALMEKEVLAFSRRNPMSRTRLAIVRYGNVLFSRGSVIPRFIEQALNGDPLTITDERMTRFVMHLGEAVSLVESALIGVEPGVILVRKTPAARVLDIAEAVSVILGRELRTRIIGTRHGEKLHETLLTREEHVRVEQNDSILRVPLDTRSLNYSKYLSVGNRSLSEASDLTSSTVPALSVSELVQLLENEVLQAVRQEHQDVE